MNILITSSSISYNEEVAGQALRPIRDQAVLAAKCGVQHGQDRLIVDSRPETIRKPERLKENFRASDIILTAEEIAAIDKKPDTMTIPVFGGHEK